MRHELERIFILSAERATYSNAENNERTARLGKQLRVLGFGVKAVIGVDAPGAEPEEAFVIVGAETTVWPGNLARCYEQRSYLERHPNGDVEEHIVEGGESRIIGSWTEVTRAEARDLAHTYDPETGLFWSAV